MAINILMDNVKGPATGDGLKNHFTCQSMSFGVAQNCTMEVENMQDRVQGKPMFQEVVLTRESDGASPDLFGLSFTEEVAPKAEVKVGKSDKDGKFIPYMIITLEKVLISNYMVSAADDGKPIESIALSYAKVTYDYTTSGADQSVTGSKKPAYDLEIGKKS